MCPLKQLFLYRSFPTGDPKRQRENLHRFDRFDLENNQGGLARRAGGSVLSRGPGGGQFRPQGGQGGGLGEGGVNPPEAGSGGSRGRAAEFLKRLVRVRPGGMSKEQTTSDLFSFGSRPSYSVLPF